MAVQDADQPANNARSVHTTPRMGSSVLGQPTFDLKATDKYWEM